MRTLASAVASPLSFRGTCIMWISWFLLVAWCRADTPVAHPGIDFSDLGGRIGVFGQFSGLSFYNYDNALAFLTSDPDSQSLYLRNLSSNANELIATVEGGSVSQLLLLGSDVVLVVGDFSKFNGVEYQPPLMFNVTSGSVDTIFPQTQKRDTVSGTVQTAFVDDDLIYLGGNFAYNGSYGAAVYNVTSGTLASLPFLGFGENATVNAITKYPNGDYGSIVFGGEFDTLGMPQLLSHNVSHVVSVHNSSNATQASLISAEQLVSLRHATFSTVNGNGDASGLICPDTSVWNVDDNVGGEWQAELPLEMQGVIPTKVRIYIPEGADSASIFRLYTFPNNGIMNLTYVDPATNQLAYCDAWCPLLQQSELEDHVADNADDSSAYMDEDDTIFIGEDGTFTMYYDDGNHAKNLGYGANYQEFAFINDIAIDGIALTVTSWYGAHGLLAGFELYLDSIRVYGNNTLNEPNCASESAMNLAVEDSGDWQSVQSLASISTADYLVAVVDTLGSSSDSAAMTLYPNISYAGDYSILFYTPGCSADDSCGQRSVVNVTVIDTDDNVVGSSSIFQNNLEDKFDYLFYGHLNGSSTGSGRNRIEIEFDHAIDPTVSEAWVVVDKVVANIVSLDEYYLLNTTNTTDTTNKTESTIVTMALNGLFEYSLGNFSDFDQNLVYSQEGNRTVIEKTNTFVGNSSINELSGQLASGSLVDQILLQNSSDASTLFFVGSFDSSNITLLNDNVMTLKIEGYNATSNSTEAQLAKRALFKRDDVTFADAVFNDTIISMENAGSGFVALGAFEASGASNSSVFKNLLNGNKTTSTANNFALNLDGDWYSFGNAYVASNFSNFVEMEVDDIEYYIFSSDDGTYKVWDNTNFEWASDSLNLEVSTLATLEGKDQQVLGGSSFGVMDYYGANQAYFKNNSQFIDYGINITEGAVLSSFFVNLSFSVIGGIFEGNLSIDNVALISNNYAQTLHGSAKWADDAAVSTLYVDNNGDYLFLGTNGSILTGSSNVTGLVIYNLVNGSFSSVQPASLSTNDESPLEVNAMVYFDDGNQLLVGGNFANAGSLDCASMCIYDMENTRWVNPLTGSSSETIDGNVTDAKFISSDQVLLSGNMTVNDTNVNFVVYSFGTGLLLSAGSNLNNIGVDNVIQRYTINEKSSGGLTNQMSAYGSDFVIGFNGSHWSSISKGISFSNATKFTDLKLLLLSKSNSENTNQQYFADDKALMLSGTFNLTGYGLVNAALYDGGSWIPYIFSSLLSSGPGQINSLLLEDVFRYQSSSDLETSDSKLSTGKVVGISLACAIGSTALIGLLYLIPMFYLFKDTRKTREADQRIHEDDMMEAVNPEELLHEFDLQRNT